MQITEQDNRITHIVATLSGVSIIRARSRYGGTVGSIHNQPTEPSGLSPEEYEIRRSVIEAKDRWKQVEIEAQCRGWPKASVLKLVSDIPGVHARNRVVHTKYNHSAIAQRLLDGASVKEIMSEFGISRARIYNLADEMGMHFENGVAHLEAGA